MVVMMIMMLLMLVMLVMVVMVVVGDEEYRGRNGDGDVVMLSR